MAAKTKQFRLLALVSHLGLLAWISVWQLFLTSDQQYSLVFIFLLYILPLLLPLPGIIKGKPYTHAWANFVVLYYLLHGLTVFYAVEEERWLAGIEILLVVGMFTGCSVFARLRGRELGLGLKKLKEEMNEECERFTKRS
ncbi:DUF2069 domain-containing protein [Alteromonas lipolytica]|uniref:DUF2069 domain-containing protein n=1 Tax=Alteromonas lipolytica TaxID=1856405 RepID=A0A1E8FHH4_9ALTE|nr:DUF2069 domain-containing protein [Alteromonas lipolytica]OFI35385.1 hypothetical protein BFC17_17285 [Alteromonas lipolytica]